MKRYQKFILVFLCVLGSLCAVAWLTNSVQRFTSPSSANEPTIKNGDAFFASRLVKPERLDFICYKANVPMMGNVTVTHRLCGLPGDKIEIRNGELYVNDENVDSKLSLTHNYRLPFGEYERVKESAKVDEQWIQQFSPDSVEVPLADALVKAESVKAVRKVAGEKDEFISQLFSGDFNPDRLGPLIVPQGKYFLLGDNRHNSQDSRYLGFIEAGQYVATMLGK